MSFDSRAYLPLTDFADAQEVGRTRRLSKRRSCASPQSERRKSVWWRALVLLCGTPSCYNILRYQIISDNFARYLKYNPAIECIERKLETEIIMASDPKLATEK